MSHVEIPMTPGTRWVPLNTLVTKVGDLENVRTVTGLGKESIESFADALLAEGIKHPLLVQRVMHDGEVYEFLLDGQRRHLSLSLLARKKKIDSDVLVAVVDEEEAIVELTPEFRAKVISSQLEIAVQREGLATYELCAAGAQLLAAGKKQADVARHLGKSESWVSRMMKAWKHAGDPLKESLKTGKITDEQFKDLAEVKAVNQVDAVKDIVTLREKNDKHGKSEAVALSRVIADRAKTEKEKHAPAPKSPKKGSKAPKGQLALVPAPAKKEAPKAKAKPSTADIADIAKLRNERSGAKHAYVRGMVDMAAYVMGEITLDELKAPFKAYMKALHKRSAA